jgi:hypothetical protein
LNGRHAADIVLVTDCLGSYKRYAKDSGVHHEPARSKEHARGAFHLAHANSLHSRLNAYIPAERRCASKYLDGYASMFRYADKTRSWNIADRSKLLLEIMYSPKIGYRSGNDFLNKEIA